MLKDGPNTIPMSNDCPSKGLNILLVLGHVACRVTQGAESKTGAEQCRLVVCWMGSTVVRGSRGLQTQEKPSIVYKVSDRL
jgi:hypothetical protein